MRSGNTSLVVTDTFELSGIAFGTIVVVAAYHLAWALAPAHLREAPDTVVEGPNLVLNEPGMYAQDDRDGRLDPPRRFSRD